MLSFKSFGHRHITDIQCVGDTYLLKNLKTMDLLHE